MSLGQAQLFEDEVRRVARILWPSPRFQGAEIIDGRERDGYFETDDAIHIVEATTERKKAKVEEDCKKTQQLVSELRRRFKEKAVKGWLILKHEPTADQLSVAKNYERTVSVIPYSKFLSRIVDSPSYLRLRAICPFGSATDPFDNNHEVPRDTFVEPYLANLQLNKNMEFSDFCEIAGIPQKRTILLGDFGAGKSMSLREFFFHQYDRYLSGTISRFPVYLNLRSHQGQDEPIEALIRHAKFVGYQPGEDLIKAWRADLTTIILDGFDELVTPAWTREQDQLKLHRASCVAIIANFLRESPKNTPIIISGRSSYFNSIDEMRRTFKIMGDYATLSINDFNPSQIVSFLEKLKAQYPIPAWVPPRPLLLGYMAAYQRKHGAGDTEGYNAVDPARGWDNLIHRFCERETDLTKGLYAESIREVLERIATKARCNQDISMPVKSQEMSIAFSEVFDRLPDSNSLGMLLRLPGLIATELGGDERRFVDSDIANISAAGDVLKFVSSPKTFDPQIFINCVTNINELAADFIATKLGDINLSPQLIAIALESIAHDERLICLAGDLIKIMSRSDIDPTGRSLNVQHAIVDDLDLTSPPPIFESMTLSKCSIGKLILDPATFESLPIFERCSISIVEGAKDYSQISDNFLDCEIGSFNTTDITSNDILDLDIPIGLRVFLTVLRKLYVQGGRGRQESAFTRGLPHRYRDKVSAILDITCSHGFASPSGRAGSLVYLKNFSKVSEALEILNKRGNLRSRLIKEVSDV